MSDERQVDERAVRAQFFDDLFRDIEVRLQELACRRMMRVREHVEYVPFLDDSSSLNDRDPVADALDDFHLMGDEENRQPELAVDVEQQVEDRLGRLWVERARRLVAEQDVRLVREGTGDGDTLLLSARQLLRIMFPMLRQPDDIEIFVDTIPDRLFIKSFETERDGDVLFERSPS